MPPYLYGILSPLQRSQRNTCCFKLFNMSKRTFQNSFLPFRVIEESKLDLDVRNVETYLLFCKNLLNFVRPIENSIYNIYDPLGIKFLHKLRVGFSHLHEDRFRHNFADTMNPLCSCYLGSILLGSVILQ